MQLCNQYIRNVKNKKGELKEELIRLLSKESNNNGFRGVVLIKREDKEIFSGAYGHANWFILDKDNNVIRGGHTGEEYGVSCRLYYYKK